MTTTEEIIKRLGIEPEAWNIDYGALCRYETTAKKYEDEGHVAMPIYILSDINRIVQEVGAEYEARIKELEVVLRRAERKLRSYVGVCNGDKELTDSILPMTAESLTNASPLTALEAERKKAKREALLEAADYFENSGNQYYKAPAIQIRRMADKIGEQ